MIPFNLMALDEPLDYFLLKYRLNWNLKSKINRKLDANQIKTTQIKMKINFDKNLYHACGRMFPILYIIHYILPRILFFKYFKY